MSPIFVIRKLGCLKSSQNSYKTHHNSFDIYFLTYHAQYYCNALVEYNTQP